MEPELISDRGLDMAACLSGEVFGVDLLIRSGWTCRTILSVWPWRRCVGLDGGRLVTGGSYSIHCLAPSDGRGLLWNARLSLGRNKRRGAGGEVKRR